MNILILEDDLRLASSLKSDFEDHGYTVYVSTSLCEIPVEQVWSYALVDLRLSNGDFGLDAIKKIQQNSPSVKIVVLSGYGSITTAVEAMKLGAVDYLTKPVGFFEIEKAFKGERVRKETEFKRRSLSEVEHEYIDFVLTKNEGNISRSAQDLGLHRQSLQRKLKKYT